MEHKDLEVTDLTEDTDDTVWQPLYLTQKQHLRNGQWI